MSAGEANMKWAICILFLLVLTAVALGADNTANQANENDTTTHIFIQEGANGSFVNNGSNNYTLTITDALGYTAYIADRPSKDVGLVSTDEFLNGFNFDVNNPPNAAIILPEQNETSNMVAVQLTSPKYDNTTKTLTYTVKLLKEYSFESVWLQDQKVNVDSSIPERFDRVILVIDDCPCLQDISGPCSSKTSCRNSCWHSRPFPWCYKCDGCCPCYKCSKSC